MISLLVIAISIIVVTVAIILYILFPKFGPHYTSRLTCPKCGKTFDFNWVPGGSFTAIRLGQKRYMRCPNCHEWSTFNIIYPSQRTKHTNQYAQLGQTLKFVSEITKLEYTCTTWFVPKFEYQNEERLG